MLYDDTAINGDYKYSDLAQDLIKYSFMVAGFRISPQSFSHLQPVGFYTDFLTDFNKSMESQILAAEAVTPNNTSFDEYVGHFYHQFIRNNFRALAYIPRADIEDKTNIRTFKLTKEKDVEYIVVGEESQEFLDQDGEFVEYIKTIHNKKHVLLQRSGGKETSAIYTPTEAYGTYKRRIKGGLTSGKMFTQYQFGTVPQVSLPQNDVNKTKSSSINKAIVSETKDTKQFKLDSLWEQFKDKMIAAKPDLTYDNFISGADIIMKKKEIDLNGFEEYLKKCYK